MPFFGNKSGIRPQSVDYSAHARGAGSERVRTHAKWLLMALSHGFSVGPVCSTKSRRPAAGRSGWHSPSVRRLHTHCHHHLGAVTC